MSDFNEGQNGIPNIDVHTISQLLKASPDLADLVQPCHPVESATFFSALLLNKNLHRHTLRLEFLVHCCISAGTGTQRMDAELALKLFEKAGDLIGFLEDPPENVFLNNISYACGNARILEGIWESGVFYLQRFVNIVDSLPNDDAYRSIRSEIHALLRLSDLLCERANLKRFEIDDQIDDETVLQATLENTTALSEQVSFSVDELRAAGIETSALAPFFYDLNCSQDLLDQTLTNSNLLCHPLLAHDNRVVLLLPTAISVAIRHHVLSTTTSISNLAFLLANEYSRLWSQIPFLGQGPIQIDFRITPWGIGSCWNSNVDVGRRLAVIFVLDVLEGYEETGFAGNSLLSDEFPDDIETFLRYVEKDANPNDFRSGIALVVMCGIGRGASCRRAFKRKHGWTIECLSASDLYYLSFRKGMKPLDLFRILAQRDKIGDMVAGIINQNGLLNLVAYMDSLNGHIVSHGQIPDDVSVERLGISIETGFCRELRYNVLVERDFHAARFVDDTWLPVCVAEVSEFEDDLRRPQVHVSMDFSKHTSPLFCCETTERTWWFTASSSDQEWHLNLKTSSEILQTWVPRAIVLIEETFEDKLSKCPIFWHCVFDQPTGDAISGDKQNAIDAISPQVDAPTRTLTFHIHQGFHNALFNEKNVAEAALVEMFVQYVCKMSGIETTDPKVAEIVARIIPSSFARQAHVFPMQRFRDVFAGELKGRTVFISHYDDTAQRLGLWQRTEPQRKAGTVRGKEECCRLLNKLVEHLEEDLCEELRRFRRPELLGRLLKNYETACIDQTRWSRSAAALMALHGGEDAIPIIRNHDCKLNAVCMTTRVLLEASLCESPLDSGIAPGDWDLSRLMALTSMIHHLGGWSDLICRDCMEALLSLRPFGEVHANLDVFDDIVEPYAKTVNGRKVRQSAERYSDFLQEPSVGRSAEDMFPKDFLDAWEEEFGARVDAYRRFVDAAEDYGLRTQSPFFEASFSQMSSWAGGGVSGRTIVEKLTLCPRLTWKTIPTGYLEKDIAPWRFRRGLSVLRRPLLLIRLESDPVYLVTPGLLREALVYTVCRYSEGGYLTHLSGRMMNKYSSDIRDREGRAFTEKVAEQMRRLGWNVKHEVKVTEILGKSFPLNYGDVDVLAWSPNSHRVLIVECKNLLRCMTSGEIAEQLSDFRGQSPNGKRDLLKKHLDRVELLEKHSDAVAKYLIMSAVTIEAHIIFSHAVPMKFSALITKLASVHTLDELNLKP